MPAEENRKAGVATGRRGVRSERADAAWVRRAPRAVPEHLAVVGLPAPTPGGVCGRAARAPASGAGEQCARA